MSINLAFTGDFFPFWDIESTIKQLSFIKEQLNGAELVLNLEAPIIEKENARYQDKTCILHLPPASLKIISYMNPLIVNLGNNHISDHRNTGALSTFRALQNAGIQYFGAGLENENHNIYVLANEKIVFFSYCTSETTRIFNKQKTIGPKEFSIRLFEKQSKSFHGYFKIVLMHWGVQFRSYPEPSNRILGHSLVDAGCDLIIGNHAHMIQGHEIYKNRHIFYCLGNFFFPSYIIKSKQKTYAYLQTKCTRKSLIPILEITISGAKIKRLLLSENKKTVVLVNEVCVKYYDLAPKTKRIYTLFHFFYIVGWIFGQTFHRMIQIIYLKKVILCQKLFNK